MNEPDYRKIIVDGLWNNNAGLVQLLGLCPLLAVTGSAINGLGLGLATTLTLVTTNTTVSLSRKLIRPEVRIPVFVLLIASVVTVIDLGMNAWFHGLHKVLGIFIPLIVVNCNIIGRAEAFASKHPVDRAFLDGLAIGLGFTLVLVTLGGLRELLGHGTLFAQAQLMFGEAGRMLSLTVIENYRGFLLAILPPGAFMGLGLLIAARNLIIARRERLAQARTLPVAPPARA
jgi:electron transport complex protein RnfE